MDYSDLYNIMSFFAGSPDGSSQGQDKLAEKISQNGMRFVKEHWRWEDMQAYVRGHASLFELNFFQANFARHHFLHRIDVPTSP